MMLCVRLLLSKKHMKKDKRHYFEVKMIGVTSSDGLMNEEVVKNYLMQHSPLPYAKQFKWKNPIQEKVRIEGYSIPCYCICLNGIELFKPYTDQFCVGSCKEDYG